MSNYRRNYRRPASASGALVTPRQAAALDRMAAGHGFASGLTLLADVASCTREELARKSRPVVQMFIDQAFQRYGAAAPLPPADGMPAGYAPRQAPGGADLRAVSAAAGSKYAYTASGARMTVSSRRCEDAPCCGCCD